MVSISYIAGVVAFVADFICLAGLLKCVACIVIRAKMARQTNAAQDPERILLKV